MSAKCPYTLQWDAPSPLKIGGIWTPSNTWFLGLTQVLNPNGILIGAAVSCRDHWCDKQTDRQTCYSVGNNRSHLRT